MVYCVYPPLEYKLPNSRGCSSTSLKSAKQLAQYFTNSRFTVHICKTDWEVTQVNGTSNVPSVLQCTLSIISFCFHEDTLKSVGKIIWRKSCNLNLCDIFTWLARGYQIWKHTQRCEASFSLCPFGGHVTNTYYYCWWMNFVTCLQGPRLGF
jgi:hypothetical protein